MADGIGGQIDDKTALIGGPQGGQIGVCQRFVGVGETALADIGGCKLI